MATEMVELEKEVEGPSTSGECEYQAGGFIRTRTCIRVCLSLHSAIMISCQKRLSGHAITTQLERCSCSKKIQSDEMNSPQCQRELGEFELVHRDISFVGFSL